MLYRSLLRPILFRLPAEMAHELALRSLTVSPSLIKTLFGAYDHSTPFGKLRRFGLTFNNPIGLAAGFDKDGVALEELSELGFGFIEAGTVTLQPQPGNPKPRLFRLPMDQALINRAGFNNQGAAAFAKRVAKHKPDCVLGVSIGKSKNASLEDALNDYLKSFELVHPVADYVAVNISSPNTPRLRELQAADQLDKLLAALQSRNQALSDKAGHAPLPLLVKLSPDLDEEQLTEIVNVIITNKIAGLIATNTTINRHNLRTPSDRVASLGEGGLSGAPLKPIALNMVARLHHLTGGSIRIIGVGGIFTADDAWEMISAGASLIQLYTGFIYQGPSIVKEINDGLRKIISREGFVSLDEAVGCRVNHYV
jgi:dihydroorotate dehydrogenase